MNRDQNEELRLKSVADKLEKQIDRMNMEANELMFRLEKSHLNLIANISPQVLFMIERAYSNMANTTNQQQQQQQTDANEKLDEDRQQHGKQQNYLSKDK